MSIVAGDEGSFFINKDGHLACFKVLRDYSRVPREYSLGDHLNSALRDVKFIKIVATSDTTYQFIALVSEKGEVYTWGSARYGLLGYGNRTEHELPMKVIALAMHRVVAVAADSHCLAVTDSGMVFGWGLNDRGQCGNVNLDPTQDPDILKPLQIEHPLMRWQSASVGSDHSLLVSQTGVLYAFGSNFHGQLGNGFFDDEVHMTPTAVMLFGHVCMDAAAGSTQSLAVTVAGKVFAWGRDYNCELGVVAVAERVEPQPIVDDSMRVHRRRRREIARSAPLVWADSITPTGFPITRGELLDTVVYYAMLQRGNTWDGQIPSGVRIQEVQSVINRAFTLTENQRRFTLPQQIPHLSEVDKVSTFESANCAVTRDGKMFTWGTRKNQEGQLVTINIPTHIALKGKVVNASISNQTNIAVMADGKVFQWDEGRRLANIQQIYTY